MFKSGDIELRRLDRNDLAALMKWENDPENWTVSEQKEAFTEEEIRHFIEEQQVEVVTLEQIRFIIVQRDSQKPLGTLDLYEVDWVRNSAFVGILIADSLDRRKNAAALALKCLFDVAENWLGIECLRARIHVGNEASERLFLSAGFLKNVAQSGHTVKDGAYLSYNTYEKWLKK